MRYFVEALRHILMPNAKASVSLATLVATGSVALAGLLLVFGAMLGTGSTPAETDAVAVSAPVFTPVALTPPAPTPAVKPSGPGASSAPRFEDAVSVTRAVQTELKRAGCYSGPINGVWTASTRAAMGEFTARVNARLPVDSADPVLLALLETHNKISCTAECNAGADGGKGCMPRGAPPEHKSEVAAVEQQRPAEVREEAAASSPSAQTGAGSAGDVGSASQDRRTQSAVAPVETASVEPVAANPDERAAALPVAVAPAPKVTSPERRRTARKYKKQPSLSREVSKGFRQIQRSLNSLF